MKPCPVCDPRIERMLSGGADPDFARWYVYSGHVEAEVAVHREEGVEPRAGACSGTGYGS